MSYITHFTARVITGSGRGKRIGSPTINMDLQDIPADVKEGIYACWVKMEKQWEKAAMHYGPRPVFKDIPSCEVHLLDATVSHAPETIDIAGLSYIRAVADFPSTEALMEQIADDINQSHAMLDADGPPTDKTADS